MNDSDFKYLDFFFKNEKHQLEPSDQKIMLDIYNRTFNAQRWPTTCSPCWVSMIGELRIAYHQYKNNY